MTKDKRRRSSNELTTIPEDNNMNSVHSTASLEEGVSRPLSHSRSFEDFKIARRRGKEQRKLVKRALLRAASAEKLRSNHFITTRSGSSDTLLQTRIGRWSTSSLSPSAKS